MASEPGAAPPLRVLIISEMSPPHAVGGGETRYALLARELVRMGHRVRWLSMRQRACADRELIDGVEHWHTGPRISDPPLRSLVAKLRFMLSVLLHLLRHRYDIVDCQTYAPLPAAWLASRLRRQPLVATIHDTAAAQPGADQWLSSLDAKLAGLVETRLYRLGYDRVLTVSQAVREALVTRYGVPSSRVSVVANGIDTEAIASAPAAAETADLIFVGRLVPHKHPEHVLELLALLNERRRASGRAALRLKIVGAGPLAPTLRAQAMALGLAAQLSFVGELPSQADVWAQLRAARVLVLPSTREGFGLVLAEALAAGAAVAAYDIPAFHETLGLDLLDCLAPCGDVAALADRVQWLLDDRPQFERVVLVGQQRVRALYGSAMFAQGALAVYVAAMARHRQPSVEGRQAP
ncbi:MAG: glycosyltransferase family 4 protein [Rubrivivax sp.]